MLDPGEDPGGGPLDRPVIRPQPVDDIEPGPRKDESTSTFRRRIVDKLTRIEKEEEKLAALKAEYKKKKQICAKLYSKKRPALRPEVKDLEEAVRKQKDLVSSLKESSGAFKEKYKNEERFNRMRRGAASYMESDPNSEDMQIPSGSVESENVGPEDEPSTSTPQTSAEPSMVETSVPLPPQQQCGTPEQEDEGGTGMLNFISELESPMDGGKLCSSVDSSDEEMNTVPVKERPVERKSDPTVSHDTAEVTQQAGTACVQHEINFINDNGIAEGCSATGSQPRPIDNTRHDLPAGKKVSDFNKNVGDDCHLLREQSTERNAMDNAVTLPGPDTAAVNGGGGAGSSGTTTIQASAIGKTVLEPRKEAECSEQGEGVGLASVDPMTAILADSDSLSAGLVVSKDNAANSDGVSVRKTYAGAAAGSGRRERAGKEHGNVLSSVIKRRNVVQLRWEGEGIPPHRRTVVDRILQMGFRPSDVFALISPAGSYEYDLSFIRPESLDIFWEKYEHVCRGLPDWKGLIPKLVSRQPLIKMVTILVRNESIPPGDLSVWLRRYGDVLSPLKKIVDDRGIWTGGWSVQLKLKIVDNVIQHLPSSAFLGRDRLTIFYPGQPKLCNKCGDKGHFASSCPVIKCSLCQGVGHLAKDCNIIRCNLCNAVGHPYSQCPEAMHNQPELMREFFRLDMEDARGSATGAPAIPSQSVPIPNVSMSSQSVSVPNMSVSSQSVSIPNVSVSSQSVPVPNMSVSSQSVVPQSVSLPSVPVSSQSVCKVSNPSVSSKIAEAARGSGTGASSAVPVPLPRRCRASKKDCGVQRSEENGEEVGLVVDKGRESGGEDRCGEAVYSNLSKDDMEWLEYKRTKGKRRKKRGSVTLDPKVLPLVNKFEVLSDDDNEWDSLSTASSMDDESQGAMKRTGSPGRESSQAKKRLPQLP